MGRAKGNVCIVTGAALGDVAVYFGGPCTAGCVRLMRKTDAMTCAADRIRVNSMRPSPGACSTWRPTNRNSSPAPSW